MKYLSITLIFIICFKISSAQSQDSLFLLKPYQVFVAEGAIYSGTMIGLNALWYKGYSHSSFHWFDDSKEWLQMDKAGHGFSSYYLTNISYTLFNNTRYKESNKDIIFGAETAWLYISTVEVFDGFSQKWGASYSDLIANTIGVGFYTFQEVAWHKQIIVPKFSFHSTKYSHMRPDALGENYLQNVLKDYNGQTYWLSTSFNEIFKLKFLPGWLCFSLGYSADGLLGGKENPVDLPTFDRNRQYLFSLDVDFRKIKVRSKLLSNCFRIINVIKVPFPALMVDGKEIKTSLIYF